MHVKILQQKKMLKQVWPGNLTILFMFRPITLKQLA